MSDDYEVGYGKPPRHSRFMKGRSGNANGRPRGAKNLKTALEQELHAMVTVKEGGRVKTLSKTEALVKSIINKGVGGDTKSALLVTNLIKDLLSLDDLEASGQQPLSEEDLAVLDHHADFLNLVKKAENDDPDTE